MENAAKEMIKSIALLSGIQTDVLEKYIESNPTFNILEHPRLLKLKESQYEKIHQLNRFLQAVSSMNVEKTIGSGVLSSEKAGEWFQSMIGYVKDKERMIMAYFDKRMNPLGVETMSEGTINEAPAYPRNFLRRALEKGATGVMICHNHPGGSLRPSNADKDLTQKLQSILEPMGISLYDHFIVTTNGYFSFREHGLLDDHKPIRMDHSKLSMSRTGTLEKCVCEVSALTGIPESKLNLLAREQGQFFLLHLKNDLPLTSKQYERLALLMGFYHSWVNANQTRSENKILNSSAIAGQYAIDIAVHSHPPQMTAVYLNSSNRVIAQTEILVNKGKVDPKDIVTGVLNADATSLILVRSLEQGSVSIQPDDRVLAQCLVNALNPIGAKLADYFVVNTNQYESMAEQGMLWDKAFSEPNLQQVDLCMNEQENIQEWIRD